MSNRKTLLIGIASVAMIGLVILCSRKTMSYKKAVRLDRIADAGYEMAADILYPLKKVSGKKKKSIA